MDFSFIQITDHHLTDSESDFLKGFSTWYSFRTVLRHLAGNAAARADFLISTGDLVNDPTGPAYRAFLQNLGVKNASSEAPGPLTISAEGLHEFPMYLVPGNHDDRENFFRTLFPRSQPRPWMNVAFVHKGIQFLCLDWGPDPKAAVHPEMLDFLSRALETDLPSILLQHYQVVPVGSRVLDGFIADDLERFWDVVAGRRVLGIFCGHVHTTYEQVIHGIPVFGLRSTSPAFTLQGDPILCLLPPHYRLVTIRDGRLTSRVFEVPL